VTLWAEGTDAPTQLAQTRTGDEGRFVLNADGRGAVLYLVVKGDRSAATSGDNPALALMTVLGSTVPANTVVNEMTTVASVWTHNQFIDGTAASKSPPATCRISSICKPADGAPRSKTQSTALKQRRWQTSPHCRVYWLAARRVKPDVCTQPIRSHDAARRQDADTLAAAQSVARNPAYQPGKLFALLDNFYPDPQGKTLRQTPYLPYPSYALSAWMLPLKFTGGGLSAPPQGTAPSVRP
jgi:hypothetical protein